MDVKEELDTKIVKTKTNTQLVSQLGLKANASRKRKTKKEIIGKYSEAYREAMNKLIKSSNDPVRVKLSKMHCAAILTLGFG